MSWSLRKKREKEVRDQSSWTAAGKAQPAKNHSNGPSGAVVIHPGTAFPNPANGYVFAGATHEKCSHSGAQPVQIGGHDVWLASSWHATAEVIANADYILPLNGQLPDKMPFGSWGTILQCELQDRGGVPKLWEPVIRQVAQLIGEGKKILAYCTGSHGRTGVFAASLIAVMEPEIEDPVAEIRKRHCSHAVESEQQIQAVFALKGLPMPPMYKSKWPSFAAGSAASEYKPKIDDFHSTSAFPVAHATLRAAFQEGLIQGWRLDGAVSNAQGLVLYPDYVDSRKDQKVRFDDLNAKLHDLRTAKAAQELAAEAKKQAIPAAQDAAAEEASMGPWFF